MIGKAVLTTIVTLTTIGSGTALAEVATKTREQVKAELAAWLKNPVTSDGYRYIGSEVGYVYEGRAAARSPGSAIGSGTGAGLTREQVRQEYERFSRNPITADGYRFVGGEVGFVHDGR